MPAELTLDSARGRWVLVATVLGSGMALLDATVVNVALPSIGGDFRTGLANLQWTVTGYSLTLSALLLLGGSLGDRYGRRRIFLVGLVWFALASLACAVATSPVLLITARAVQGMGSALVTPGSLAIIESGFRSEDRGRAIGAWSGLGGLAAAIGPLAGGVLVDAVSWRLVFFINLPVAVAAWAITARHVPETLRPGEPGPLDVRGPALAALGLGAVTYALIEGPAAGWSAGLATTLVLGVVLLTAFVVNEGREPDPLLPLGLFRSREFSGANGATFVIYAALGAVIFLVVLDLQTVLRYSPLAAGSSLMPLTLLLLVLSSRSGRLASDIGPRVPMTVGPLLAAVGMLLFSQIGAGTRYAIGILPGVLVFGLGLVLTVPALTTTALGAVESGRAGIASAVNNDVARVGGLAAVAIIPALAGISTAGSSIDAASLSSGFRTAMYICAGLCAAGGVISFLTIGRRPPPRTTDHAYSCPLSTPPPSSSTGTVIRRGSTSSSNR